MTIRGASLGIMSAGWLVLALLLPGLSAAQNNGNDGEYRPSTERSSFDERRKSILDANNLRATYHNFGFGGRTGEDNRDELYYEYPKNTNRRYIYFVSVFVGAEVQNQQNPDERMPVVITPNYRTSATGDNWNFNPVPGYFNPNSEELARSDMGPDSPMGNTWPDFWPDKMEDEGDPGWRNQWNGFFGKNIFNADQEFYYRASDDQYTRFSIEGTFRPDNTDPSRGGLGLIVDARIMAWTQNLIADVHFNIYEIRNDASFDYQKVSFMLWTADWVGTPSGDRPFFDQRRAIAYYTTINPTQSPPEFDNEAIGVGGIRFLETPGNAVDGIDNDGDSDFYNPSSPLFSPLNPDLYQYLIASNGGFFANRSVVENEVVPLFTTEDFQPRVLRPGDPIVLIDENYNRILMRYPDSDQDVTVVSQGREIVLRAGGMTLHEDTTAARHLNLLDDDLDGLIDEQQPNHLTKTEIRGGVEITRPVRYINYTWEGFYAGHNEYGGIGAYPAADTIQRGLAVPNSWIRQRKAQDPAFREQIDDYRDALIRVHGDRRSPGFFDQYYRNHHTSAPMIDESREDYFDNNRAWNPLLDDVGLDGVEGTGARGEGDGFPTSGAGTPFPGEPGIDKTDVAETDAIGITSATFRQAGALGGGRQFERDPQLWSRHLVPGRFELAPDPSIDTDQFVTSGFFPLMRGQTERFAIAVTVAQQPTIRSNDQHLELANEQLEHAYSAYEADYQFARAPLPPILTVVPGDGMVTLYWDERSEDHFDRYLQRIGANPNNFQGYRVYRATDVSFRDALTITDGRGIPIFRQPIAQFDRKNGLTGFHPIDINGVKYWLGNDTGLEHFYEDTGLINGRKYYYAVTAYTYGSTEAFIAPSESPISISQNPDGTVVTGVNVVEVMPSQHAAGYAHPQNPALRRIRGTAGGQIQIEIVDPRRLKEGHEYQILFADTLIAGAVGAPDTVRTKHFSLLNLTESDTLIHRSENFRGEANPVKEGFRVRVTNDGDEVRVNHSLSGFAEGGGEQVHDYDFAVFSRFPKIADYRVVFGELGMAASRDTTIRIGQLVQQLPGRDVNFRVFNTSDDAEVPFAFFSNPSVSRGGRDRGEFSASGGNSDVIYFIESFPGQADNVYTWRLRMRTLPGGASVNPSPGDTLYLFLHKPFTTADEYRFTIEAENMPEEDRELARDQLENIRVVPNPYIVTHLAEPRPTAARPNQHRQLHFTNLPARCTIRIFTVAGQLVQTLDVNNSIDNGRYIWDMLTKDNLELAYGVYIYHVDAPDIGEKVGRFAVIK